MTRIRGVQGALLLSAALCVAAGAVGSAHAVDKVVLFEDFGATWCGPCVPARCGLNMLQQEFPATVIEYELHVSDVWETNESLARANYYAVSGIPHVRPDGGTPVIGASTCTGAYNAYRNKYIARINETGGASMVDCTGGYSVLPSAATEIQATAVFEQVQDGALSNLRATIVVYQDNMPGGYEHVFRDLVDQNVALTGVGDQVVVNATIPVIESEYPQYNWVLEDLKLVAYLQNVATKEVYQAAFLDWDNASSVDDILAGNGLRILYAQPNPFRPMTRIGFQIPAGGAPADLGVYDLAGRRVATLFSGSASEGLHEVSWKGVDHAGNPLASGVYFVRLVSGGSSQIQKVIRFD